LRLALLHEPSPGLSAAVADDIGREVRRTPQRRPTFPIAPWARWAPEPGLGYRTNRGVRVAIALVLLLVLLAALVLIGALLRRPSLLGNGVIALAPPDGGIVLLEPGQQSPARIGTDLGTYVTFSSTGDRLAFWSGPAANAHGAIDWTLSVMDVA